MHSNFFSIRQFKETTLELVYSRQFSIPVYRVTYIRDVKINNWIFVCNLINLQLCNTRTAASKHFVCGFTRVCVLDKDIETELSKTCYPCLRRHVITRYTFVIVTCIQLFHFGEHCFTTKNSIPISTSVWKAFDAATKWISCKAA